MMSRRFALPLCLVIVASVLTAGPVLAEVKSPPPGSVYREIKINIPNSGNKWRVTDPDASNAGSPGNSPSDFLPNPVLNFSLPSGAMTNAISAEVIVDYWGGHVGTVNQQLRFNNKPWRSFPELDTTPTAAECYTQQWNPVISIPVTDLRNGSNTLEGNSGGQTCFNFRWGQWGWYGAVLRIYYEPSSVSHPTGSIASPSNNGTIGDNPTVRVNTSSSVSSVEVFARYDGPDWDGDGDFLEYHQAYHRPKTGTQVNTSGHVGTDTSSPYNVVWNTELVPDQAGIRLIARIRGSNGIWYVTPERSGIRLQRSSGSVLHFKPWNVPRRYWVRLNSQLRNLESNVTIPNSVNLGQIRWAKMILRTWNGNNAGAEAGQTHKTWFNDRLLNRSYGANHHYEIDVVDIPVAWLRHGTNVFRFDNTSTHHGVELLWPGPELVIGSTQEVDGECGDNVLDPGEECDDGNDNNNDACDNDCNVVSGGGGECGDGTVDPGEQCDDGNTSNGDGCQSDCTLPVAASTLPAMYPFEGSGNSVEDVANDNNGTLVSNAQRTNAGRFGKALVFNGSSGHVNLGPLNLGGPFTIAMWFKAHDFGISDARLISKATGVSDNEHFFMISTLNSNGRRLRFRLKTTSGATTTLIADQATLTSGRWIHVAAVWTGSQMRIYQDGSLVGNVGKGGAIVGDATVEAWVGDQTNGGKSFDGEIDELVIDDRAYSAAEVTALMNAPITPGGPDCGNGLLDAGESCDDGNTVDGDGCQADCELPECGDGIQDAGEDCDDGNNVGGDGCQGDCALPTCGDNVQDPGEACDDGNDVDGDGCSADCSTVDGPQPTENAVSNGDFADLSAGWTHYTNGSGSLTVPGGEACIDIDTAASNIQMFQRNIEVLGGTDYVLRFRARANRPRSIRVDLRQHVAPYSGYGLSRTFELGTTMSTHEIVFTTTPGDKDDGRLMFWLATGAANGDQVYLDDIVIGLPTTCGDGVVDSGEDCDDGNATVGDGCDTACRIEACGNGRVDFGEACDDGNTVDGDGCQADCRLPVCGDGILDPSEACDDGNTAVGDGCDAACRIEACGNGRVDFGETCDDGNDVDGDGCQGNCQLPTCGDGIVDSGEACDDGNDVDDDGCSNTCETEGPTGGPNLLSNGDFSSGEAPWRFYSNGAGAFDASDGFARLTIGSAATNIQLYQRRIAIAGGTTHRLRFRARNTAGADMELWLRDHVAPYTNFGLSEVVNLTPEWTVFTIDFTTTPGDKNNARLMFWIGPFEIVGSAYEIDDVELFELP